MPSVSPRRTARPNRRSGRFSSSQIFSIGAQASSRLFSPDIGEADPGLGLVAASPDVDDHAVAVLGVADVVADLQPQLSAPLGATGLGLRASDTLRSRLASMPRPHTLPPSHESLSPTTAPPPQVDPAVRGPPPLRAAVLLDQLLGDLARNARRRVVLGRAVQCAGPGR